MQIIEQNRRQLDLLKSILIQVTKEHYQQKKAWPGQPSVGKHVRHVLDHYQQLWLATESGRLDYRLRLRDEGAQTNPAIALQWIERLETWLQCLEHADLEYQLHYLFAEGETYSSLHRELDFVASHCVHHLALIHALLDACGYSLPQAAGIHSSTQEYHRRCAR